MSLSLISEAYFLDSGSEKGEADDNDEKGDGNEHGVKQDLLVPKVVNVKQESFPPEGKLYPSECNLSQLGDKTAIGRVLSDREVEDDKDLKNGDDGCGSENTGSSESTQVVIERVENRKSLPNVEVGRRASSSSTSDEFFTKVICRKKKKKRSGNWIGSYRKRQEGVHKRNSTRGKKKINEMNSTSETGSDSHFPLSSCKPKGELLKCPYCLQTFSGRDELIKHLEIHQVYNPHGKIVSLQPQAGNVHPNSKNHPRRPTSQKLDRMRGNKSARSTCEICGASFTLPKDLVRHSQIHTDGSNKPWKCQQCPSFFLRCSNLSCHENRVHGKRIGPMSCLLCKQPFTLRPHAFRHLRNLHGIKDSSALLKLVQTSKRDAKELDNMPPFQQALRKMRPCKLELTRCDHLLSKFRRSAPGTVGTQNNLRNAGSRDKNVGNGKGEHSPQARRTYTCPYCFESFLEPTLLIEHLPVHTKLKEEQNGKEIPPETKSIMKVDENVEGGSPIMKPQPGRSAKQYRCNHCGHSFAAIQFLHNHMKLHSEEGRAFKCRQCDYNFTTFKSLRIHEGHHHKGTKHLHHVAPVHKCKSCSYSNKSLSSLMFHMERHKDVGRQFKCIKCNYTFKSFHGLRIHESRFHPGSKSSADSTTA